MTDMVPNWASHEMLHGVNGCRVDREGGRAEPGTWVLACALSHGLRDWRTLPDTSASVRFLSVKDGY